MTQHESRFCELGGCLPNSPDKVPHVLAERGLYARGVGCNHLGCPRCGQSVQLFGDVWRCGCLERRVASTTYMERQDHGLMAEPELPWRCQGHPRPTDQDLRSLGFTDDVLADVHRLLTAPDAPPYRPSGYRGYRIDVRLDLAETFDEQAVRDALVQALDGEDDVATERAMRVLFYRDWVPLEGAVFRWRGLNERLKPGSSVVTLGRVWSRGISRIARREGEGSPAWEEARRLHAAGAATRNSLLRALFLKG